MAEQTPPQNETDELAELWALFAQEGQEVLDQAEAALLQLETDPSAPEPLVELFRALHTFKGNTRFMGLTETEKLAHQAEELAGLVRDEGTAATPEIISLLLSVVDRFRETLAHVQTHHADVPPGTNDDLLDRLQQAIEAARRPPEPPSTPLPEAEPPSPAQPVEPPPDLPPTEVVFTRPDELVDPATDPQYVRIFLEMAGQELGRLHLALDDLAGGKESARQEIEQVVQAIHHAAGQMGYDRLLATLEAITDALNAPAGESRTRRLYQLELELFEQLTVIQEAAPLPSAERGKTYPDIAWLFRNWHADRVFAYLSELVSILDELESRPDWPDRLLAQAAALYQSIHHSCIFYRLADAGRLSLMLEDLFARLQQGEPLDRDGLLHLARAAATRIGNAIDAIRRGEEVPPSQIQELVGQAETLLYSPAATRTALSLSAVKELLHLPPQFEDVLVPENLAEISQAIQKGEQFYTVLADLNADETVAEAFLEWSQSGAVRVITSATVYRNHHVLYDFLLSSALSLPELQTALARLDPSGRIFTLSPCHYRGREEKAAPAPAPAAPAPAFSTEKLRRLMETIGRLEAVFASLHHTVTSLPEFDHPAIDSLRQIEGRMAEVVVQVRDRAAELRRQPVAAILEPGREQATAAGIPLYIDGGDTLLDTDVLNLLTDPLQKGVEFALARAQKAHNPEVRLLVEPMDDRVRISIEDNGPPLDHQAIIRRAEALGWSAGKAPSEAELLALLLRPDFGPVPGSPVAVDFGAVYADLQPRDGFLQLSYRPGGGLQQRIELPLDTAVLDGMVLQVGQLYYVVPLRAIRRIVKPEKKALVRSTADGVQVILRLDSELIPLRPLSGDDSRTPPWDRLLVIVDRAAGPCALPVDELLGQQRVLIEPTPPQMAHSPEVSGLALLGDGRVAAVLNVNRL